LKRHFATHKKKEQKRFAGFFDKLQQADESKLATPSEQQAPTGDAAPAPAMGLAASSPASAPPVMPLAPPETAAAAGDTGDSDNDSDIGEPLGDAQSFEPTEVTIQR